MSESNPARTALPCINCPLGITINMTKEKVQNPLDALDLAALTRAGVAGEMYPLTPISVGRPTPPFSTPILTSRTTWTSKGFRFPPLEHASSTSLPVIESPPSSMLLLIPPRTLLLPTAVDPPRPDSRADGPAPAPLRAPLLRPEPELSYMYRLVERPACEPKAGK